VCVNIDLKNTVECSYLESTTDWVCSYEENIMYECVFILSKNTAEGVILSK